MITEANGRSRLVSALALMALAALGLVWAAPAPVASAQSAIEFSQHEIENDFPDGLTFRARAQSSAGTIERAEVTFFSLDALGSEGRMRRAVTVVPGSDVQLEYTWDTQGQTVVPSQPVVYSWRVWDSEGNSTRSAEMQVRYDDVRFDWNIAQNDSVAVWTHDRPTALAERAFEISTEAVRRQRALFDAELAYQVRLIVYNNFDEFAAWHSTVADYVGGQAFPGYGITTQIVPLVGPQEGWLLDVVPHEIAHLYFAQVTNNPKVSVPVWLNEGVATYMEFSSQQRALARARGAAEAGELVPLSSLATGFGSHNESRARLAYDEALSAVVFIIERYGDDALAELLRAYREGMPSEEAFQAAFGVGVGEFEAQWASWLGVPEGQYVTATPWPSPSFLPSPTPGRPSGPAATDVSTPIPTSAATALPETTEQGERMPLAGRCAPALGFTTAAALLVSTFRLRRRRSSD